MVIKHKDYINGSEMLDSGDASGMIPKIDNYIS
jgi:hypothetical protein